MKEVEISPRSMLLWPLTLPSDGFMFILEQIRDAVNEELYDPEVVRRRLLELQMRYETEGLSEDEYLSEWEALTERLDEIAQADVSDVDESDEES